MDSAHIFSTFGGAIGIIAGFVIVFFSIYIWNLYMAPYHQRNEARGEGVKLKELLETAKILRVGGKVENITTSGHYDTAFGGHPEGDMQVHMLIVLTPSKPMILTILALELWGKRFKAEMIIPEIKIIEDPITCRATFNIPKDITIDTKAVIYVVANGFEYYSAPIDIHFKESPK